jgi:hypothetical protein
VDSGGLTLNVRSGKCEHSLSTKMFNWVRLLPKMYVACHFFNFNMILRYTTICCLSLSINYQYIISQISAPLIRLWNCVTNVCSISI